jgi:two-component system phosphate regulon sensor histidine kinase PhoR
VKWAAGEAGAVVLKVSDTGPGISPEHHDRLFERFYRVDKGRSRDLGGTGLGLAIVKHIMQRHGGNVEVRSEMGAGSTFICRFPAG